MNTADLTYTKTSMFYAFLPNTPAGEKAWRELAEMTGGTGKVLHMEFDRCVYALRKAGYTVAKSKPMTAKEYQAVYDELDELLKETE